MSSISLAFSLFVIAVNQNAGQQITVLRNVALIDGTGKPAQQNRDVTIKGDKIASIKPAATSPAAGSKGVDLAGKTIMPELINTHGHLGLLKGTTMASSNYTEENI